MLPRLCVAAALAFVSCSSNGRSSATCNDGVKNGSETDIDCGGTHCGACEADMHCVAWSDCLGGSCVQGFCEVLVTDAGLGGGAGGSGGGSAQVAFDAGTEEVIPDAGEPEDAGSEPDAGPAQCRAVNDAGWPMWQQPVSLSTLNSAWEEASPTLTADRLRLCFCSTRPGGAGNRDIYCSSRGSVSDPWPAPMNQLMVNTSHLEWMPALSADGRELYFAAELPTSGSQDLFVSIWDQAQNQYGPPQSITAVNNSGWQTGPGISADGLTLYYNQALPNGAGSMDIYSVKRATRNSPWGTPQLEPTVNSTAQDELAKENANGSKLVWCSNRPTPSIVYPDSFALYGSTRTPSGWSIPVVLDVAGPAAASGWSPTITSNGDLLFASSRSGGFGDADLYLAPAFTCDN